VPSHVPAADQALTVLAHLARQAGPVPAAAVARDLGLPRSTTYHLLSVLVEHGFAVHVPEEHRYGLGVAAFELGSAYSRQAPLTRLARPVLARLVDRVGQSAHLAVLHGREVLYLVEERAAGRPPLVTDVGVRLPAHLAASGRAILAGMTSSQVRALFPDRTAFAMRTGSGPSTLVELRQVLADVRRRGHATEDGEVTPGFASVAAAACDHTGHPVAGVAVTFAASELVRGRPATNSPQQGTPATNADDKAWPPDLVAGVRAAAAELTRRIGGRPG
jgi:DNA-binding IclR family transcriptional regulator